MMFWFLNSYPVCKSSGCDLAANKSGYCGICEHERAIHESAQQEQARMWREYVEAPDDEPTARISLEARSQDDSGA